MDHTSVDRITRLALEAGRGDQGAFAEFVLGTQADVWRCCAHLVSLEAADDLTQDTYLRLVSALPRFRGDASGRTFALSIARRVCVDEIRRRTRRRALTERLRGRHVVEAHDGTDVVPIDALVAGLDADRRDAFVLTQILGLSYEEAALVCACAVGTIRSRVSRARQVLIEALGEQPERTRYASG